LPKQTSSQQEIGIILVTHLADTINSFAKSAHHYAMHALAISLIFARHHVNFQLYGKEIPPQDIRKGAVAPPRAAQPLYDALAHVFVAASGPQHST
jgi:lipid-binding SYLF domain-containing protein